MKTTAADMLETWMLRGTGRNYTVGRTGWIVYDLDAPDGPWAEVGGVTGEAGYLAAWYAVAYVYAEAVPELVARIRELEVERADLAALEAFLLRDGSAYLVLSNEVGKITWEVAINNEAIINEATTLPAALRDIRGAMRRLGEAETEETN